MWAKSDRWYVSAGGRLRERPRAFGPTPAEVAQQLCLARTSIINIRVHRQKVALDLPCERRVLADVAFCLLSAPRDLLAAAAVESGRHSRVRQQGSREECGREPGQGPVPPVAVVDVVKRPGLPAATEPPDATVSAALVPRNDPAEIGVQEKHHPQPRRVSTGHAMGHDLLCTEMLRRSLPTRRCGMGRAQKCSRCLAAARWFQHPRPA